MPTALVGTAHSESSGVRRSECARTCMRVYVYEVREG